MAIAPTEAAQAHGMTGARRLAIRVVPVLLLCLGAAGLLLVFRDALLDVGRWGYLGAFLAELADSALFFMPTPAPAVVFALGSALNPWLVGLLGGLGAAAGTATGYLVGTAGRGTIENARFYAPFKRLTARWGGPVLFLLAVVPSPADLGGMWAGAAKYPLWRFLIWVTPAKVLKVTSYAVAGGYSAQKILQLLGLA